MAALNRKSSVKWVVTWKHQQRNTAESVSKNDSLRLYDAFLDPRHMAASRWVGVVTYYYRVCLWWITGKQWQVQKTGLQSVIVMWTSWSHKASQHSPAQLSWKREPFGRVHREQVLSTRLLRDRSKDSLGFEGLGQTAWGPLKAMALRWEAGGRERLAAREGYL